MIMSCGLWNLEKFTSNNSNDDGLGHTKSIIVSPTTLFIGRSKQIWSTPILVNVNKFKPYQLFKVSKWQKLGV
jgi:hypothetical protein